MRSVAATKPSAVLSAYCHRDALLPSPSRAQKVDYHTALVRLPVSPVPPAALTLVVFTWMHVSRSYKKAGRQQTDRLDIVLCSVAQDLRVRRGARVPEAARPFPSRSFGGRVPVWREFQFFCVHCSGIATLFLSLVLVSRAKKLDVVPDVFFHLFIYYSVIDIACFACFAVILPLSCVMRGGTLCGRTLWGRLCSSSQILWKKRVLSFSTKRHLSVEPLSRVKTVHYSPYTPRIFVPAIRVGHGKHSYFVFLLRI